MFSPIWAITHFCIISIVVMTFPKWKTLTSPLMENARSNGLKSSLTPLVGDGFKPTATILHQTSYILKLIGLFYL